MNALRDLVWFTRNSWTYNSCHRGTGRWRARRMFVRGFIPAARYFLRASAADRREMDRA